LKTVILWGFSFTSTRETVHPKTIQGYNDAMRNRGELDDLQYLR
jgi:hypothetical protein